MDAQNMDTAGQHATDVIIATAAAKTTYVGSGMTITGWMLSSQFAVLVGMLVGIAGLLVNWYYRHKLTLAEIKVLEEKNARERAEHAARMGMYQ